MNLVKLLSRVWVGFVLFGLLIPLVDALAAVFIFVMGVVEVIGIALGPFGAFFGVFIGIALGAYAAYRVFKWIDGKMRAVALTSSGSWESTSMLRGGGHLRP
ncbi:hypothetical protein [Vulcanisaeta distributa]|uniref:hypothetical protein n=1 Tax=Vulcanisaeta distributa TaxID=164451 RepID=UPI0006D0368C|nr:hypothetical protein [Vulcanisaeta distributa]